MNERQIEEYLARLDEQIEQKIDRITTLKEQAEGLQFNRKGERVQTPKRKARMEEKIIEYLQLEQETDKMIKHANRIRRALYRYKVKRLKEQTKSIEGYQDLGKAVCELAVNDYKLLLSNPKALKNAYTFSMTPLPTEKYLRKFIESEQFYYWSGGLDGKYIIEKIHKILNVSLSE